MACGTLLDAHMLMPQCYQNYCSCRQAPFGEHPLTVQPSITVGGVFFVQEWVADCAVGQSPKAWLNPRSITRGTMTTCTDALLCSRQANNLLPLTDLLPPTVSLIAG